MPLDSTDDNLEHVHAEWLRRLQAREITREGAGAFLQVMNARLEFLRNLHSRIAERAEFAQQARDVEQEIQREVDEIKTVERYIDQADDVD
jgi:hypothetical protein